MTIPDALASLALTIPRRLAFDVLYHRHKSVMTLPLSERRKRLQQITAKLQNDRLQMSSGIVGEGMRYFREVKGMGLEGVVAKGLDSRYVLSKRPGALK